MLTDQYTSPDGSIFTGDHGDEIGSGCFRNVYELDARAVIKYARSDYSDSLLSNLVEAAQSMLAQAEGYGRQFAEVYAAADDGSWIIMERVETLGLNDGLPGELCDVIATYRVHDTHGQNWGYRSDDSPALIDYAGGYCDLWTKLAGLISQLDSHGIDYDPETPGDGELPEPEDTSLGELTGACDCSDCNPRTTTPSPTPSSTPWTPSPPKCDPGCRAGDGAPWATHCYPRIPTPSPTRHQVTGQLVMQASWANLIAVLWHTAGVTVKHFTLREECRW